MQQQFQRTEEVSALHTVLVCRGDSRGERRGMKATILLASVGAAQAFIRSPPISRHGQRREVSVRAAFDNEVGVTPPLGYWDPLGLSLDGDETKFFKYRVAEIKHGRIAMLAALHYLVSHFVRLPGTLGDVPIEDIRVGLGGLTAVPQSGWAQIVLFAAALEVLAPQREGRIAGDVQPDTALFRKLDDKEPAAALDYQNKELNNGRLAMIALLGMWVSELLTGQDPIDTLILKVT